TGVNGTLLERDRLRESDPRFGTIDPEIPSRAGRVPVKLVEILEEADLPRRAIFDRIVVATLRDEGIGAADAHAYAIAQPLGRKVFRRAIARNPEHVEGHLDLGAVVLGIN